MSLLSLTHNGLVLEKSYTGISFSIVMKHLFFHFGMVNGGETKLWAFAIYSSEALFL